MILAILIAGSLTLTYAMFSTRERMLGFPCAIFWMLLSGHAFTLSTVAWGDIEYYLFFSSAGLAIFTMFAAFALKKKDLDNPDMDSEPMLDEKGNETEVEEPEIDEYEEPFKGYEKGAQ